MAEGHVEFVARTGDFVPLAASLIERRLRWIEASEMSLGPPWAEFPADLGEIFRHEINNPLTGILGNAELLLGHPDIFPPSKLRGCKPLWTSPSACAKRFAASATHGNASPSLDPPSRPTSSLRTYTDCAAML